jgi:hypothetical protein
MEARAWLLDQSALSLRATTGSARPVAAHVTQSTYASLTIPVSS